MKAFIPFLLFIFSVTCFGQKSPIKFGEIPMEDMKMTVYPQDSSAAAVVLADYGESYLSFTSIGVSMVFERHVRIKILTKDGLEWANAEIPLYHSGTAEERITNLKASTYNLEGGKIVESKMDKAGVFKEKFNTNFNLSKFTLPNVKEGSVIEYSYKRNSEFVTNFPNWQFQRTIPTRHSEFWAIIPEFFVFQKYMQGYVMVSDYEVENKSYPDYNAEGHHWTAKNVPAFKEEPYMTSEEDYISRINFAISHFNFPGRPVQEIMGSWEKLNTQMLESSSFGGIIKGSGFLKKTVDELIAGKTDVMDRITAIHSYVKDNIEWNGQKDKYGDSPKKTLEAKIGTAADINLTLASMLEKAEIPVEMVLLSTRDHGFLRKQYPMEDQLNYTVCLVRLPDGKNIFLDATDRFLPVNVLPEYCLNGEGMIVSKTNHGWIKLETKAKAKTVVNTELTLSDNGELKGKVLLQRDGYDANKARKNYVKKGEETYLKDFLSDKNWQVEKSAFENVQNITAALKETHELTLAEHASSSGDVIYISPFIISQTDANPFKSEERLYPVDYGALTEQMYMIKLVVPDGYTFDEIPQSKIMMMPNNAARYTFNVTQTGNMINILSNLQINRSLFLQDEYPSLREFYNQVIAKQAEQIVLKKKL